MSFAVDSDIAGLNGRCGTYYKVTTQSRAPLIARPKRTVATGFTKLADARSSGLTMAKSASASRPYMSCNLRET